MFNFQAPHSPHKQFKVSFLQTFPLLVFVLLPSCLDIKTEHITLENSSPSGNLSILVLLITCLDIKTEYLYTCLF